MGKEQELLDPKALEAAARAMEPLAFRDSSDSDGEWEAEFVAEGRAQAIGRAKAAIMAYLVARRSSSDEAEVVAWRVRNKIWSGTPEEYWSDWRLCTEQAAAIRDDDSQYEVQRLALASPSGVKAGVTEIGEGWQPIETAPKDGTRILATCVEAQSPRAAITWWSDRWMIQLVPDTFVSGEPRGWFPTHWQSLATPPIQGDAK